MKREFTTDNTIIVKNIFESTTGEIDFDMYDDILGHEKVEVAYESNGVETVGDFFDAKPLKIEVLKQIIADAEKEGCNYITIDYNCDHPDYTFYGVDVHSATDEEIKEIHNKEKKSKEEKAKRLREQAERFTAEAKKLEE
jgi:hypothetical protein